MNALSSLLFLTLGLNALSCRAGDSLNAKLGEQKFGASYSKSLSNLPEFPIVHYSWPIIPGTIDKRVLLQFVRLTGAYSIRGESHQKEGQELLEKSVQEAVEVVSELTTEGAKRIPTIAINYSVWHHKFNNGLPPTDEGHKHKDELELLQKNLTAAKNALEKESSKQDVDSVTISAILFDSERFFVRRGPEVSSWNDAIFRKHQAAFKIAKDVFPAARIEWYARGGARLFERKQGWNHSRSLTLKESGSSYSCSIYTVPEIGIMRESFQRTARFAAANGVNSVTPWIALASGFKRTKYRQSKWTFDWDYDPTYSWQLGAEVNSALSMQGLDDWAEVEVAVFYPEPFGRVPSWAKHFLAYAMGASNIVSMDE